MTELPFFYSCSSPLQIESRVEPQSGSITEPRGCRVSRLPGLAGPTIPTPTGLRLFFLTQDCRQTLQHSRLIDSLKTQQPWGCVIYNALRGITTQVQTCLRPTTDCDTHLGRRFFA